MLCSLYKYNGRGVRFVGIPEQCACDVESALAKAHQVLSRVSTEAVCHEFSFGARSFPTFSRGKHAAFKGPSGIQDNVAQSSPLTESALDDILEGIRSALAGGFAETLPVEPPLHALLQGETASSSLPVGQHYLLSTNLLATLARKI